MIRYLLRRLAFLALTLLLTSLIIFVVTQWLPGDVARVILGREASETSLQQLREQLGLNQPLPVQYLNWLGNFVTGNWGKSYSTELPIRPLVLERMNNSLMLALVTVVIAVPLAITFGVVAGLNEHSWLDNAINVAALSVVGLPEFVTGLILIEVFAFQWHVLPSSSSIETGANLLDALPSLILPALTTALVLLAYVARHTRAGVIEELKQAYVRTAVLKGLLWRTVVTRHVLRNALLPAITVTAISLGWLLSGLVVVENVFNYPGLGRLLIFAIDRRDLPLLQAIALLAALSFALSNLAADVLYALLNPRIRLD